MTSYGGQAEASLPHWGCDVRNCRHLLGFWEGQRSDVLRGPAHGRSSAVTSYGDLNEASPCLGGGCDLRNCRHVLSSWESPRIDVLRGAGCGLAVPEWAAICEIVANS